MPAVCSIYTGYIVYTSTMIYCYSIVYIIFRVSVQDALCETQSAIKKKWDDLASVYRNIVIPEHHAI